MTRSLTAHGLDQEALEAWGERVGREAGLPLVLCLRGELGAGKSTLARAIARGAGVPGLLPSPTFNLLFRYEGARADGPLEVVHADLYRLRDPDEVWELGWRELGEGRQIVVVEWPERAETLLPAPRWEVTLRTPDGEPERRDVEARAVGDAPTLPGLA